VNFYDNNTDGRNADYNIIVNIRQIAVTPDLQGTRPFALKQKPFRRMELRFGSERKCEKRFIGNDIKTPKYKTIQCILTEYLQQKSSSINGTIDFYNTDNNSMIYSYPFSSNEMFQHAQQLRMVI
jgi:hypothetical protein